MLLEAISMTEHTWMVLWSLYCDFRLVSNIFENSAKGRHIWLKTLNTSFKFSTIYSNIKLLHHRKRGPKHSYNYFYVFPNLLQPKLSRTYFLIEIKTTSLTTCPRPSWQIIQFMWHASSVDSSESNFNSINLPPRPVDLSFPTLFFSPSGLWNCFSFNFCVKLKSF